MLKVASFVLALAALVLSVATAFFGFRLQKDDLRVIISPRYDYLDHLKIETKFGHLIIDLDSAYGTLVQNFTFLNGGTRSASVLSITFRLIQVRQPDASCISVEGVPLNMFSSVQLDPVVVEPGKMVVHSSNLMPSSFGETPTPKQVTFPAHVCSFFDFVYVVPGQGVRSKSINLGLATLDAKGTTTKRPPDPRGELEVVLISHYDFWSDIRSLAEHLVR